MISAYFSGRLGNQFFEYAYCRRLLEFRGGYKDCLLFNYQLVTSSGSKEDGFEDSLKYFNVKEYATTEKNLVLSLGDWKQKFLYLAFQVISRIVNKPNVISWWFKRFRSNGLLFQQYSDNASDMPIPSNKNIVCYGKYENPKYFDAIRPILLKEFTPKYPERPENESLYKAIRNANSVCIAVRRGDFLEDNFKNQFYVCNRDYFFKAIAEARKRIENPTFIFFSNDIEWVKQNIILEEPCYYESGEDPVWETIRLMYNCKHFIMSNSTFSWWAQYLSRNEKKVVIAPDRWSNNPEIEGHLLLDSFIKIPISK